MRIIFTSINEELIIGFMHRWVSAVESALCVLRAAGHHFHSLIESQHSTEALWIRVPCEKSSSSQNRFNLTTNTTFYRVELSDNLKFKYFSICLSINGDEVSFAFNYGDKERRKSRENLIFHLFFLIHLSPPPSSAQSSRDPPD